MQQYTNMQLLANLETWLAEENSIIQKSDQEKQAYLYEWLERLTEYLNVGNVTTDELKKIQPKIISTLHKILEINCSPGTRQQLAKCFATVYHVGTTLGLFDSVNKCIDQIKSRDDSPNNLPVKLSAICCVGAIYEKLGRMVATLFDVGQQSLIKMLYKTEPEAKCEILLCFQRMLYGLGNAASSGFRDIYKACKSCLVDKSMSVRWATAKCTLELSKHATFLCTTELETIVNLCFKALEGSDYDVRVQVGQLLGFLMASSQTVQPTNSKTKKISVEDMFSLMAAGFLRGGTSFMKANVESGMNREIRVGVTQAYVVFFHEMGTTWVSKYLAGIIIHTLELVASQKATSTHIDAVYSRKCISFILNSILSGMLSERLQVQSVKELCKIISKQMNNIHDIVLSDSNTDSSLNMDVISTQHVLVCALEELSNLILSLTSSIKPALYDVITEAVFSTLIHPAPAVWLSAAWCIRCCSVALQHNMLGLINSCMKKMSSMKSSKEAVTGYGYTLAAIVGGLYQCPLGIPYSKVKELFVLGEELLHSTTKSNKLQMTKLQTGWILLGSLCTLGGSFVKGNLMNLLQLWSSVFPASKKDSDAEKAKGHLKSWQLTLENRAGALCCMASFVSNCSDIITPDIIQKLMIPIDAALALLPQFQSLVKLHGAPLQPSIAMFKARLFQLLGLVHPKYFETAFTPLLRVLVSEFTLADRKGSITTSLLQSLCHKDDSILLGSWLQETDHKDVEEQLQLNSASGSGALEHDSSCIYARCPEGQKLPGPLPLGVAVIDAAISLFGHVFPTVTNKHRAQLMQHFNECITKNKGSRQQAIQTNIFTAFLAALKNLAENKSVFGEESALKYADSLIEDALSNPDHILRCAAGEALGRMAQVMNDPDFVARMAQRSFEKCQKTPDAIVRTGHALALGCLHRYVGGMGSGQHLGNSVSILIALSKDSSSSLVQVWSLHGLTLIADSGGPMFRTFVDQSLQSVINLLLSTPPSITQVHQCLGKCFGALITAIGPELQDTSKVMIRSRSYCMTACSIMQHHPDSLVRSEGVRCLQQLHVFAPNVVNLNTLVPHLCNNLLSPHLLLRKVSVDCFRQLVHREAKEICELSAQIIEQNEEVAKKMYTSNKGLEGLVFSLLDIEVDARLLKHLREIIISLLTSLAANNLKHWLGLSKQVLLASTVEEENTDKPNAEYDDEEEGQIVISQKSSEKVSITPKWPNRVFAMECIRMIFDVCKVHNEHIDLSQARKMSKSSNDYLVMQLSELVRMAFIAGTSPNNQLKLEGMKTLQEVVILFAKVPDPDLQGHLILEQFQAQVGTALRPAFAEDVPPDVTAMACEVCSSWIGSGISRDINDVHRLQQLLVNSLSKIGSSDQKRKQLFSESAYTLETLAVLKAWAQIYIMAMKDNGRIEPNSSEDDGSSNVGSLLDLVESDLKLLTKHWIGVIRDYVLLTLPPQYASQLPPEGGTFYSAVTMNTVRSYYLQAWPPMVHAIALWLTSKAFPNPDDVYIGAGDEVPAKVTMDKLDLKADEINRSRFHLIIGVCVEAMCSPLASYPQGTIETCIATVNALLSSLFGRKCIVSQKQLCIELLTVLHRLLLSSSDHSFQHDVLSVVRSTLLAFAESLKESCESETQKDNREKEITPRKSLVFSVLEICTYLVSKYASDIMPTLPKNTTNLTDRSFSPQLVSLYACICDILSSLPEVCSPSSSIVCLPTILFLQGGILKYICMNVTESFHDLETLKTSLVGIVKSFKKILSCDHASNNDTKGEWEDLLMSCLHYIMGITSSCKSNMISSKMSSPLSIICENLLMIIYIFISQVNNIESTNLVEDAAKVFSETIADGTPKLRLCAIKIVECIIKIPKNNISFPFIRECIPQVVGVIENRRLQQPTSDVQLSICKDGITLFEHIIEKVEEINQEKMMAIYIPALINLLHDSDSLSKANSFSRSLHEYCIERLTAIGPMYPQSFRAVMSQNPDLKTKLTLGIKANETIKIKRSSSISKTSKTPAQPQIKLKMDFSNFK